jgi:predicted unusual protein kinase regulating ubiquinone biosynthesis (AarF/ABC1/UbiB family)
MARLGGLAAGVAGNVALGGGRALMTGNRPQMRDLLLTPANAARITDQLAQMRGAAMKVGQLLSMEADEFLPPELADILGHLRSNAHFMPPAQLKAVLSQNWGPDFLARFKRFDVRPIAAASIGQVHRAQTRDGRDLAIKVQYPGVRQSIDSDVRNVSALMRMSGLLPKGLDLAPLMEEARRQLHDEADYTREAEALKGFAARLEGDPDFVVPQVHHDLTTGSILAMDFVNGVSVDDVAGMEQDVRDRFATRLIALMLRELFAFEAMQSDPNFANYRYDPATDRVVLLDFGATRDFPKGMADQYRRLLAAGLASDRAGIADCMIEVGLIPADLQAERQAILLDLFEIAMAPLVAGGVYDFAASTLSRDLREGGMALAEDRDFVPIPPIDTLYLQRKIGGLYLLAVRLKARVDLDAVIRPYRTVWGLTSETIPL